MNEHVVPANISISDARLPLAYESAKAALANCESIDECVAWSDKAAALASYAKQADDETLMNHARRIQARAVRRAGELLKQIESKPGTRNDLSTSGGHPPEVTRGDAARSAGMSPHQAKQAIRVANVPDPEFEHQVEAPAPATVTKLAEQGTRPRPAPASRPDGFIAATLVIGTVEEFARFCAGQSPETVAAAVMPHEINEVRANVREIDAWLDRFVVNLRG